MQWARWEEEWRPVHGIAEVTELLKLLIEDHQEQDAEIGVRQKEHTDEQKKWEEELKEEWEHREREHNAT